MKPLSKLKIIGVLAVVVVLLMIGLYKEDSPFRTDSQPSQIDMVDYEPELSSPMYYLVIGSFLEESNSREFSTKVTDLGYEHYRLPRTDGYIRVGVFASPYREDVEEFKKTIKKDFPKSWITYQ